MPALKYYQNESCRFPELALTVIDETNANYATANARDILRKAFPRDHDGRNWFCFNLWARGTAGALSVATTKSPYWANVSTYRVKLGERCSWLVWAHEFAHLEGVLSRGWKAERHDRVHQVNTAKWVDWLGEHYTYTIDRAIEAALDRWPDHD